MIRSALQRGNGLGAGSVLRLWRSVLAPPSRRWQTESPYRANAEYRPEWKPPYLLFAKNSELPHIGLASARAEGFVTTPGLASRVSRHRATHL